MDNSSSSGALTEWFISSVRQMYPGASDSVTEWLGDLRGMTECECMCVLQGKSLSRDSNDIVMTAAKTTKDYIDSIKSRAHIISTEFTKLYKKIEKERWRHVKPASLKLASQIRSLLQECTRTGTEQTQKFNKHQQTVMEGCAKLAQYVECDAPEGAALLHLLTQLGEAFSTFVDTALGALVRSLLQELEERDNLTSEYTVRSTLSQLVSLGLEGEHLCYIITREGGVSTLLDVCLDPDYEFAHTQCLRAVATICCVQEAIEYIDQVNGVSILTTILSSPHIDEAVRVEAAGVIAQLTSPGLQHGHINHLVTFLENMDDLLNALTELCMNASSAEAFLLSSAAIANITFVDTLACDLLLTYHTPQVLVQATSNTDLVQSIYAKDQVVTILSNMTSVEGCCDALVESDVPRLLVYYLHLATPPAKAAHAELAAFEHVQQKSAIAITRLARDPDVAQSIVDMKAVPRLVALCRRPELRNSSDAVLVACLAALRKVCATAPHPHPAITPAQQTAISPAGDINYQDALQQLIQPNLMESFTMCSSHGDDDDTTFV